MYRSFQTLTIFSAILSGHLVILPPLPIFGGKKHVGASCFPRSTIFTCIFRVMFSVVQLYICASRYSQFCRLEIFCLAWFLGFLFAQAGLSIGQDRKGLGKNGKKFRGPTPRRERWRRTCSRVRPGRRPSRHRAASAGYSTPPGQGAARAAALQAGCKAYPPPVF